MRSTRRGSEAHRLESGRDLTRIVLTRALFFCVFGFDRRLGHRHRIGAREGFLQAFLKLALEPVFDVFVPALAFRLSVWRTCPILHTRPSSIAGLAQAHIERALAAMRNMRVLEADHKGAKLRQIKPLRHLPAQHAAFALAAPALAGDHQHQARAAATGRAQEMRQRGVRFALRQTMQIETAVDGLLAAGDARPHAAAKRRQRCRRGEAAPAPAAAALPVATWAKSAA